MTSVSSRRVLAYTGDERYKLLQALISERTEKYFSSSSFGRTDLGSVLPVPVREGWVGPRVGVDMAMNTEIPAPNCPLLNEFLCPKSLDQLPVAVTLHQ